MTSRLKRKLETQQQDGGSGSLTESFVSYGTALPSLADTKKDSNEFVPVSAVMSRSALSKLIGGHSHTGMGADCDG